MKVANPITISDVCSAAKKANSAALDLNYDYHHDPGPVAIERLIGEIEESGHKLVRLALQLRGDIESRY